MTIVNEELAYKILDLLVQNSGRMDYIAILNALKPTSAADALDTLTDMISDKLISGQTKAYERISITNKGKTALQIRQRKLEEEAKKTAQNIADKRSDRRFQIISAIITGAIVAIISAVIDLLFGG